MIDMRALERVNRALSFRVPDRVPFFGNNGLAPIRSDFLPLPSLVPKSWRPPRDKSPPHFPHVYLSQLQTPFLYSWKPSKAWNPKPPKKWYLHPRTEIDEWGVIWNGGTLNTMGEPLAPALESWDKLDEYQIPDGSNPERYAISKKITKFVPKKSKFRIGLVTNFIFEQTHFIRGWENYMRDLFRHKNELHALIKKIMPYYYQCVDQLHEMGANAIYTTDDWGSQRTVLISPKMFDEFYRKPYEEFVKYCHDLGMKFVLHSCGKINKLIPKFIDIGVDALEFDAPHMVGLEEAHEFSGKITFFNCIDIQKIYPFASPEEVIEEFKQMAKCVGNKGGGFVAFDYFGAHEVLNVPKQNIRMFERAVKKYGKYDADGTLLFL